MFFFCFFDFLAVSPEKTRVYDLFSKKRLLGVILTSNRSHIFVFVSKKVRRSQQKSGKVSWLSIRRPPIFGHLKNWDQNGWFFIRLGPELEVFSHWACWGFPVGPWYFGGPDCFMHSVRRKPLSLYKNYTHYTLQVERFFSRGSKFPWSWSWEFCFSGWYLCQRGERCGRWDGFGLPAALSCILWWQIPLRQEPIMAGPAGLSKRSVGLRLSDE